MTPAHTAAADQAAAKEREFTRRAHNAMLAILWLGFSLGVYSFLAVQGHVPAAPWSPIGQQIEAPAPDAPVVEIPPGYEPAVPAPPTEPPALKV